MTGQRDPLDTVCIEQQETITKLSMLCRRLLIELAQFRAVDAEEERLKEAMKQQDLKEGKNQ